MSGLYSKSDVATLALMLKNDPSGFSAKPVFFSIVDSKKLCERIANDLWVKAEKMAFPPLIKLPRTRR